VVIIFVMVMFTGGKLGIFISFRNHVHLIL
jgi:hypothetical protein